MKETPIKTSSRKAMKYRGVECLNCGHPLDLTDRFCAYCGQINTTKRLTLKDFISEFVLSVFTYDSKFWYTLKDLLFKPGRITRNYVDGKRFHYANPFRFFLSASIFYFILISTFSFFEGEATRSNDNLFGSNNTLDEEQVEAIFQDSIGSKIQGLPKGVNTLVAKSLEEAQKEAIKNNRENKRKNSLQEASGLPYHYVLEKDMDTLEMAEQFFKKFELFQSFYQETDILDTTAALDSLDYSSSTTNIWLYNKMEVIDRVEKNPIRFLQYLLSKTPFFLFFFAPLFALFFWLIYSKKKANYMEHLVFIFHIFSWIFIVLLICLIPDKLLPTSTLLASIILLLIGPFYFYKALRNFYDQSRTITVIKFVFLNIVFFIGISFFALIFFTLTATFY